MSIWDYLPDVEQRPARWEPVKKTAATSTVVSCAACGGGFAEGKCGGFGGGIGGCGSITSFDDGPPQPSPSSPSWCRVCTVRIVAKPGLTCGRRCCRE